MTETVLFVGGRMDGKRQVFSKTPDSIDIPVWCESPHIYWVDPNWEMCIEWETYNHAAPHCYLISTESPDNLIPLLIEGYRKVKE